MTETPAVPTTPRPTDVFDEPRVRPSWSDLPLEQTVALRAAATRLQEDFADVFGVETVERFLHTSFDQFASRCI